MSSHHTRTRERKTMQGGIRPWSSDPRGSALATEWASFPACPDDARPRVVLPIRKEDDAQEAQSVAIPLLSSAMEAIILSLVFANSQMKKAFATSTMKMIA